MKKSISINIQGIIFNIEEDGYERLRSYFDSLRNYFVSYEGSDEILNDIESRIAEIFQSRLTKSKEVITYEDVTDVIATLGEVSDFEEQGMDEDHVAEPEQSQKEPDEEKDSRAEDAQSAKSKSSERKQFYKDGKRKILGGVASGLANYFGIDPVFIRIIIVILVFAINVTPLVFFSGISVSLSTLTILAYIVLWIILPTSRELEGHSKLYRDDENGQLAGVAGGLAKYMGIDALYIRLMFIAVTLLGGSGILIYVILWIIVPKAKTVSEKVQMQGKPLTVDNIEQKIKDNFNLKEDAKGDENLLSKILFFPFRILGYILKAIGPGLKGILDFTWLLIRFSIGFGLIALALCLSTLLLLAVGISFGISQAEWINNGGTEFLVLQESIPLMLNIAIFMVGVLPAIFMGMLGVSLLIKRNIIKPIIFGSMFGLWIVSVGFLVVAALSTSTNFQREANTKTSDQFSYDYKNLTLDVSGSGLQNFQFTDLEVNRHSDSTIKLVMTTTARGLNQYDAEKNTKMITYSYQLSDSTLMLDNHYNFKDSAVFRAQELKVQVFVPHHVKIHTTSEFDWKFGFIGWGNDANVKREVFQRSNKFIGKNINTYTPQRFNEIKVNGAFRFELIQSDRDSIEVVADSSLLPYVSMKQDEKELEFKYDKGSIFSIDSESKNVLIKVWSKTPEKIVLSGVVNAKIGEIRLNQMKIDLSGASSCSAKLDVSKLVVTQSGSTDLNLSGAADNVSIKMNGSCVLVADELQILEGDCKLSGTCDAGLKVRDKLKAKLSGVCTLRYSGDPKTDINMSGSSSTLQL